jgi:hypothetical protein
MDKRNHVECPVGADTETRQEGEATTKANSPWLRPEGAAGAIQPPRRTRPHGDVVDPHPECDEGTRVLKQGIQTQWLTVQASAPARQGRRSSTLMRC